MQTSEVNPAGVAPGATSALRREAEALPAAEALPGAVVVQYIRCGKQGCRCRDGDKHGPYHYRVWREGLKVRKTYIRQQDLAQVRAQCALHQRVQAVLRDALTCRLALLRRIAARRRERDRSGRRG